MFLIKSLILMTATIVLSEGICDKNNLAKLNSLNCSYLNISLRTINYALYLKCSNNKADEGAFNQSFNGGITHLTLDNCPLIHHYSMLSSKYPAISTLVFVGVYIEINPNFFNVETNITELDLKSIRLKKLYQRVFANLKHLQKIDLSYNEFTELPSSLFEENHNLKQFYLKNNLNSLDLVDGLLANKINLLEVSFRQTKIKFLPSKIFTNSLNIEYIDLSLTKLKTIDRETFHELDKLRLLDLSTNRIKIFTDEGSLATISRTRIEKLDLRGNKITKFAWNASFFDVKALDLQFNNINELKVISAPYEATQMEIDLNNNNIRRDISFNFENLQPLDNFTLIMSENPYECSCVMENWFQHIENLYQVTHDLEQATCTFTATVPDSNFFRNCPKFECLRGCRCHYDDCLTVDCSSGDIKSIPDLKIKRTKFIKSKWEPNMQSNEILLRFENNSLKKLPVIPLSYQVVKLFASNNSLDELLVENLSQHLEILDLRNNKLRFLNVNVIVKMIKKIKEVYLGGNPWQCDCSTIEFFKTMKLSKDNVKDYENLYCDNLNIRFEDLNTNDICFDWSIILITFGIFFGTFGLIIGLFYKYRKDMKIFLYAHDMCLWFVTEEELDEDKIYDAFFCFAALDQPLVEDIILDLEKEPTNFKLLVGIRDWPPGRMFPELISNSVEQSRRTILFVSSNFLTSHWCHHEFRAAQTEAFHEQRKRIIVITYGDVQEANDINEELKSYLRMHLYVKYEDPRFWQKLCYAMPHKSRQDRPQLMQLRERL